MSIERLAAALDAAGIQADDRELAEVLWLAAHIAAPLSAGPAAQRTPPAAPPPAQQEPAEVAPTPPSPPSPPSWGAEQPDDETALHPSGAATPSSSTSDHDAVMGRSPTAVALPHTLDLLRALRPLKRRTPSPRNLVFDEDATVTLIADAAIQASGRPIFHPVLRPAAERWLRLALVIDTGASMVIWRPLVAELHTLLERLGAFSNIRVWHLHRTPDGPLGIHPQADPVTPLRSPHELIDPSGRQAVLVVSDCVDDKWRTRAADHVLDLWGRK